MDSRTQFAFAIWMLASVGCPRCSDGLLRPPTAPRDDGAKDPYGWMNRSAPRLRKYIEEERAYARAFFLRDPALVATLQDEIINATPRDESGSRTRIGNIEYYVEKDPGRRAIHFRRTLGSTRAETVLDENILDDGASHFVVKGV